MVDGRVSLSVVGADVVGEGSEEMEVERCHLDAVFWMPLNPDAEAMGGGFECLDDPVF